MIPTFLLFLFAAQQSVRTLPADGWMQSVSGKEPPVSVQSAAPTRGPEKEREIKSRSVSTPAHPVSPPPGNLSSGRDAMARDHQGEIKWLSSTNGNRHSGRWSGHGGGETGWAGVETDRDFISRSFSGPRVGAADCSLKYRWQGMVRRRKAGAGERDERCRGRRSYSV